MAMMSLAVFRVSFHPFHSHTYVEYLCEWVSESFAAARHTHKAYIAYIAEPSLHPKWASLERFVLSFRFVAHRITLVSYLIVSF